MYIYILFTFSPTRGKLLIFREMTNEPLRGHCHHRVARAHKKRRCRVHISVASACGAEGCLRVIHCVLHGR